MNAKNIFKMEFYRNFRDKSWLIVIGVMAILALIDSILIINLIGQTVSGYSHNSAGTAVLAALTIFFTLALGLGIWAFQIIYQFHLLSVDYSNKALGLMIASGVNRMTYYFNFDNSFDFTGPIYNFDYSIFLNFRRLCPTTK